MVVKALLVALLVFRLLPPWFFQPRLAEPLCSPLGDRPSRHYPGSDDQHLHRLRLHSLIERIPGTHRYEVPVQGARTALFCIHIYNRLLRPGLAQVVPKEAFDDSELRRAFDQFDEKIEQWIKKEKVPA
jgi:hypothetical protein